MRGVRSADPIVRGAAPSASALERFAGFHARARQRRVLGIRSSAIVEVLLLVLLLLLLDRFLGQGNRLVNLTPHPFWLVVLLAASYYGLREALFATAVCSAALLVGAVPAQAAGEGGYAWQLRVMREPLLWLAASLLFGAIRDAFRGRMVRLSERVSLQSERTQALTQACDRLSRQKLSLESRIASQEQTVQAMYNASRAIERDGVGDVLMGVSQLVQTTLSPRKFSLYLLDGTRLEAAISEGWQPGDRFTRSFEQDSDLHRAIVGARRVLVVADPSDEGVIRQEGVLAGPIIDRDADAVVGMLKVEAMDYLDLNTTSIQNFRLLCDWIGAAITHAQHMERVQQTTPDAGHGRVAPRSQLEPIQAIMQLMVQRAGVPASLLVLDLTLERPTRDPERLHALTQAVARALERSTHPSQLSCATNDHGGYVVALPLHSADSARPVALHIVAAVRQSLEDTGVHAMVRHRIVPLADVRRAA